MKQAKKHEKEFKKFFTITKKAVAGNYALDLRDGSDFLITDDHSKQAIKTLKDSGNFLFGIERAEKKNKGIHYLIHIEEKNGDKEYSFKRAIYMKTKNKRTLDKRIKNICSTWYDDDNVELTVNGWEFSDGIYVEYVGKTEITEEEYNTLQKFNI